MRRGRGEKKIARRDGTVDFSFSAIMSLSPPSPPKRSTRGAPNRYVNTSKRAPHAAVCPSSRHLHSHPAHFSDACVHYYGSLQYGGRAQGLNGRTFSISLSVKKCRSKHTLREFLHVAHVSFMSVGALHTVVYVKNSLCISHL